jgi:aminoglycoside phosphotransferase (APT) family kinase protein
MVSEADWLDRAGAVRAGEELDATRLEPVLLAALPGAQGPLRVEQFARGYSNLTYLLRLGDRELVLRRPPFGANIKGGHDMSREVRILRGLEGVYPKAPRPLYFSDDTAILGAPFYVMERVRGVILRTPTPPGLTVTPAVMRGVCTTLVDTLADLHAVDYAAVGLGDLGRPEGYVARQVQGWSQRYANARTHDLRDMDRAATWLADHLPPERGAALIHNDFKLDNLVLDPGDLRQVRAVLDWEMATIGDPLMDLGTTLGYWVEATDLPELQLIGLANFPGSLRRREVVARYAATSGSDVSDVVYYYVFGLFKIAVIAQQIYFRYHQGYTQDRRFAALDTVVAACARMAAAAIDRHDIQDLV